MTENGTHKEAQAIVVRPAREVAYVEDPTRAFEPHSLNEALKLAEVLSKSRLLPKAVTSPEAAFAIIATGRELGLTAMRALRSIHVVEGKPTLSADLIVALVKQDHSCEYFKLVESTDTICTCETKRRGEPEATRLSWTIDDAKVAGLVGKDNWRKYPRAMLRARCSAELCRAVYPDVVLGLYDPDELERPLYEATAPGAVVQSHDAPRERTRVSPLPIEETRPVPPPPSTPKLTEEEQDRLLIISQELIVALDEARDLEAVRALKSSVEKLVEPFRTPVREKYNTTLRKMKAEAQRSAEQPREREPGEEG